VTGASQRRDDAGEGDASKESAAQLGLPEVARTGRAPAGELVEHGVDYGVGGGQILEIGPLAVIARAPDAIVRPGARGPLRCFKSASGAQFVDGEWRFIPTTSMGVAYASDATAQCSRSLHGGDGLAENCQCGFYAFSGIQAFGGSSNFGFGIGGAWLLEVDLFGQVLVGRTAVRAARQRVRQVILLNACYGSSHGWWSGDTSDREFYEIVREDGCSLSLLCGPCAEEEEALSGVEQLIPRSLREVELALRAPVVALHHRQPSRADAAILGFSRRDDGSFVAGIVDQSNSLGSCQIKGLPGEGERTLLRLAARIAGEEAIARVRDGGRGEAPGPTKRLVLQRFLESLSAAASR